MATHSFSFPGGDILSKMGAVWFVSFIYYDRVDPSHTNWKRVATYKTRISKYNSSNQFHKEWLQEIIWMDPEKLNKNQIGIDAKQVREMVKKVLASY